MPATHSELLTALEAEQSLLGCILRDPIALIAARILQPADFSRDAHAIIFATLRQLDDDGLPVNTVRLTTRLDHIGQLARAGGSSYIASLAECAPGPGNPHLYAQIVRQAAAPPEDTDQASYLDRARQHFPGPQTEAAEASAASDNPYQALAQEDLSPEEARAQLTVLAPGLQTIQSLLHEEQPPTRWIVPDLLPEGLTLLAAKPKLGKSWMALGLALAVASGGTALGQIKVEPGPVLYLALEDSKKRLHARTRQLLQGKEPTGPFAVHTQWPRLGEGGLAQLKLWLQAEPGARLIILDTLAKIRGRMKSSTLYGEDYASLEAVQALAHQYEVGILVIHHTGKESREDPLDEVNATQGLNGVADNVLVLRRQRGKAEAVLVGDGRELNGVELPLRFDGATGAWAITEPAEVEAKTPERVEILQILKASAEPMSPMQVAKTLGKNVNTIRVLLARMARDSEIQSVGYGKYTPFETPVNAVNGINGINGDDADIQESRKVIPLHQESRATTASPPHKNQQHEARAFTAFTAFTGVEDNSEGEKEESSALPRAEDTAAPSAEAPPLPPAMRPKTGIPRMAEIEVSSLEGLAEMLSSDAFYLSEEAVVREAARLVWQTHPESHPTLLRFTLGWLRLQNVPLKVEWCAWIEGVAERLWRQHISA